MLSTFVVTGVRLRRAVGGRGRGIRGHRAPLQQQVESAWNNRKPLRLSLHDAAKLVESSGNLLESIAVNPANGRLSLVLGSAVAELAGHQLLLAPTMAAPQQLAWICVPVGIAAKYLPVSCRK